MRLKRCKPVTENLIEPLNIAELIAHTFHIQLRGLEYYLHLFLSNQEHVGYNYREKRKISCMSFEKK